MLTLTLTFCCILLFYWSFICSSFYFWYRFKIKLAYFCLTVVTVSINKKLALMIVFTLQQFILWKKQKTNYTLTFQNKWHILMAFYKLGRLTWVSDLRTPSLLLADCDCREFKQWQKLAILFVTLQKCSYFVKKCRPN
jgi:hypothetical protein